MRTLVFRRRPALVVAAGVVFSSLSAILIRLSDAPALAIASYRLVFTVAFVTPLFLRETARGIRREEESVEDAGLTGNHIPGRTAAIILSVASGVFLALHFGLWITSLEYTSVASSTVLVTTHPIIVAIAGAVILRERISGKGYLATLGAIGGSILLAAGGLGQGESQATGNLLAFLGAVAVAGYIILGRIVRRRFTVNAYTMIVYTVAALLLVGAAIAFRTPLGPYPAREFVIFASLALFCTMLGHTLFSWALRYVRPALISTSILGEPVIATTLALILFGEVPSWFTLGGGAVILASIYFFVRLESDASSTAGLPPGGAVP